MQDITVPPVNTNPGTVSPVSIDMGAVGILLAVLLAILMVVYWWHGKTQKGSGSDVRVEVEDMMDSGITMNMLMLGQFAMLFPLLIGLSWGGLVAQNDFGTGVMISLISVLVTGIVFFILRDRSREQNANRYSLSGYLWKKDGSRIKYWFSKIKFGSEIHLTEAEIEAIYSEKLDWKEEDILRKMHVYPALMGDEHRVFLIMDKVMEEAFEWVDDEDYDYFGTITIKSDGPELREVATLHRVAVDSENDRFKVNEYVPTLYVVWGAGQAKDSIKGIPVVDPTADKVLAGLITQIGAERRVTSGELNAIDAALISTTRDYSNWDTLAESIGRKKAKEYLRNEERLTTFDMAENSGLIYGILALIAGVVIAAVAYNAGYAQAILELVRGVTG